MLTAYLLGVMSVLAPSMIVLAWALWQARASDSSITRMSHMAGEPDQDPCPGDREDYRAA